MKRLTTLLIAALINIAAFSQAPHKMSYQAVVRNSAGQLVTNTQIGMKISILQGTSDGTVVYSEVQTPSTNANGLVSIEIGGEEGFENINWTAGPYFIKTEIAVEAPLTTYTLEGTSQILSVPYAQAASTFDKLTIRGESVCDETTEGAMRYNPNTRSVEYCNGSNWIGLGSGLSINLPMVNTTPVSAVTISSAETGGVITDNGGAEIIQKGVVWNTAASPTIANNKTLQGTGSASFVSSLTGLIDNTLYYTRAYATNTAGTGYGEEMEFTTLASLSTTTASEITFTSFIAGGDINVGGGQEIIERGVVYGNTGNPTVNDSKVIASAAGTGLFSVTISNVQFGNSYNYRAYSINAGGLSYGDERRVSIDPVGAGFTDSRDENTYATVWLGGKEWMAENLKYLPLVRPSSQFSETNPYYYVYDYQGSNIAEAKATSNFQAYGVLYNWPAALQACPAGWHLPSDEEWTELENHLIANGYNYDGTTTENKIAKSMSTSTGWATSTYPGTIGNNDYPEKQNATGFSALPGGHSVDDGFWNQGGTGNWWSATEHNSNYARGLRLEYSAEFLERGNSSKGLGCSIRCIRDSETSEPTHALSLQVSPDGSGLVTGAGHYAEGTLINITATVNNSDSYEIINANYEFIKWTGDTDYIENANAASTKLTMPGNAVRLTANFELTHTEIVDVFNPATGRTWMDRNLGAGRAATSSTDALSYGDLYQWGRAADGHQLRTSDTTRTLSSSDNPGHGNFITTSDSPYDWRIPQNTNLWQGVSGVNNPCPSGYRLPTLAEFNVERMTWSSNNQAGAYASPLKLPLAGHRHYTPGIVLSIGSTGNYWSSTIDGTNSMSLYFRSNIATLSISRRSYGYSVRCIKEDFY